MVEMQSSLCAAICRFPTILFSFTSSFSFLRVLRASVLGVSGYRLLPEPHALRGERDEARRHHLAALQEPVFRWSVVGDRLVDAAEVVPDQHIPHRPMKGLAILVLGLVGEEV